MESQGLIQAASYVGNSPAIALKAYGAISQFSGWAVTSIKNVTAAIGSQIASNASNICKTTSTFVRNGRTVTTTTSCFDPVVGQLKAAAAYMPAPQAVQFVMSGLSVAMPFLAPMAGAIKNHMYSNRDLSRQQNRFQEFKATGRALNPSEVENHIALADELTSELTSKADEYHKLANRSICSWSGAKKFIGVNLPLLFLAPELGMVAVGCFIVASAGAHILSRMSSTESFTNTAQKLESMAQETQQSVTAIKHLHQENKTLLDDANIAIETAVDDITDLQEKQVCLMEGMDELTRERTRLLDRNQERAEQVRVLEQDVATLNAEKTQLQIIHEKQAIEIERLTKELFLLRAERVSKPSLQRALSYDPQLALKQDDDNDEEFVDASESVTTETKEATDESCSDNNDEATAVIQPEVVSTPYFPLRMAYAVTGALKGVLKKHFDFTLPTSEMVN